MCPSLPCAPTEGLLPQRGTRSHSHTAGGGTMSQPTLCFFLPLLPQGMKHPWETALVYGVYKPTQLLQKPHGKGKASL